MQVILWHSDEQGKESKRNRMYLSESKLGNVANEWEWGVGEKMNR